MENLSAREKEVLKLIVKGLTNPEIARILHISENTVREHVKRILKKLEVRNRINAAVLAVRQKII